MTTSKKIRGGVCAPQAFEAGATGCGIKTGKVLRDDLALIFSGVPAVAAATFTTNKVKAAPVRVSMEHLKSGKARAVILNSGNANACTGEGGLETANRMAAAAGEKLGLEPGQVLVCSTGRIGVPLPVERIEKALPGLIMSRMGSPDCARAIMTSDTFAKEIAFEITTAAGPFRVGGIAKGAGMIDPNMATMLCVVTTDAAIPQAVFRKALRESVERSFNRITVDGDMSTNDTVIALANGASGVQPAPADFQAALDSVTTALARMIVEDGEGVSKFVEVEVRGAKSARDARLAAEAIANSTLVKCAWAGGDPNWGRIMDAVGYSGAAMEEASTDIYYDDLKTVAGGLAASVPAAKVKKIVGRKAFRVAVDLGLGDASYFVLTTDLTEEYVRLNLGE
jgi:glutamate N-acetyltransferase / amino-acid N-acetyltransferase